MSAAARFLFAAWPFQGHLFPQIALAHALRRRGHSCAFYTGSQRAEIVEREGFECFRFRHVDEDALNRLMRSRPAEPWRFPQSLQVGLLLRRWLFETVDQQVRDLEEVIQAWSPHAIGSDPTMWGPGLVIGEKYRLPVAVCSFIPACPLPGNEAPPWGPGLPSRADGWRRRAARRIVQSINATAAQFGRRMTNDIRRRHGLRPIATSASEHIARAPLYLVPCTREFDYNRRDVPSTVHYVGPYMWNRPSTEPPAPWLPALRHERPCVHVTEGTVHVHKPLVLPAAMAGLAGLPLDVVVTTGGNPVTEAAGPIASAGNIFVARWVSHADLLPRTDVMVTTGGAGSVLAALSHGVPLVLVPTEWDKPEIAQRVVEAGAGVRIEPRRCTAARLRDTVLTVLNDASYRLCARRVGDSFTKADGAERAADLLVSMSGRSAGA